MNWMLFISDLIIPLTFAGILLYALSRRVPVYDNFIEGAKDGFVTVLNILPTIIGIMVNKQKYKISTKQRHFQ